MQLDRSRHQRSGRVASGAVVALGGKTCRCEMRPAPTGESGDLIVTWALFQDVRHSADVELLARQLAIEVEADAVQARSLGPLA